MNGLTVEVNLYDFIKYIRFSYKFIIWQDCCFPMPEKDPASLYRAMPDKQFMAPGGRLMAENDPPSLCQATARQARHGSFQATFKPGWIKAVFLFRSGFKTPSKAQWLRCRPPVNAHIPYVCCAFPVGLTPCP
jgi:hypothetical protein